MSGARASRERDSCWLLCRVGGLLLSDMDLIQIYQCLCDRTRLRILHLLTKSPLCVCHFQDILAEPQVKISKHLSYLRNRGMVVATRDRNWMVYALPKKRSHELETNFKCLQDCVHSDPMFARDLRKLTRLRENCCEPAAVSSTNERRITRS
jgi:ArsR family transcriptional regulator, arsenate/arsenite/antimonite-responsive transcriptional repressor